MKYWAFLSYSHTDKKWGDWLHKALETYRVPRRLVGKESRDGKVPERVYPIFRDREELPVSADLGSNINEALRESRYLIVICSPRSAQSRWVGEEIKTFKKLGREDQILALIVDGEPNASDGKPGFKVEDECFHEAMRYRMADGEISEIRTEPIAADAREIGDGKTNAKLKLLAGLLGVNYDDLKQREQERRLRRARIIVASAVVLVGIFAVLSVALFFKEREATRARDEARATLSRSDFLQALRSINEDRDLDAIAQLARSLRSNPTNRAAACRLVTLLAYRNYAIPCAGLKHDQNVRSAQFTLDGKRIMTSCDDKTVRIWDAKSGRSLIEPIKTYAASPAQLSPDGNRIVTVVANNTLRISDSRTGKPISEPMRHDDAIMSIKFSDDGKKIVSASKDQTARVWDAETGKPLTPPLKHDTYVYSAEFSPNGKRVVTLSSDDTTARLWDVETGKLLNEPLKTDQWIHRPNVSPDGKRQLRSFAPGSERIYDKQSDKPLSEPMADVQSGVFSSDGKLIITKSVDNKSVRVWDAMTGKALSGPLKHDDYLRSVELDPNCQRIVTASVDKTCRLWDALTGKPIIEPITHDSDVESAEFSPDGKRIVTASGHAARVWDAQTGKPLTDPMKHESVWVESAWFSPDGKQILTASLDKAFRVWDAQTGKILIGPIKHDSSISSAKFSPDGKRIVTTAGDTTARVWDARTSQLLAELKHDHWVDSALFSPDCNWIVTARGFDDTRIWRAENYKLFSQPLTHDGRLWSAHFSSDGKLIVTASIDKTARVWDAETFKPIGEPMMHDASVGSAEFSRDGKRVVTASHDKTARVWDSQTGRALTDPLKHDNIVLSAKFSQDGKQIVTASYDNTARVWDATSGKPITQPMKHDHMVSSAQFSADGGQVVTVATEEKIARVWDVRPGKSVSQPLEHDRYIYTAQFSADGNRIVTATHDDTFRVWDTETAKLVTGPIKSGGVQSARFSPDSTKILTAEGGEARIWDAATGKQIAGPLKSDFGVNSAEFSPGGLRVVTAAYDKTVRVWDAGTGKSIFAPIKHEGGVTSAHFNSNGDRLVTASDGGVDASGSMVRASARVWDAQSGRALTEPLKHANLISSVQFSPDGKQIVTASQDKTARVWDAKTGQPLGEPMKHDEGIWAAEFSPDGKRIVTASEDKTARVWDAKTGQPLTDPMKHVDFVTTAQFSPDGRTILTISVGQAGVWDPFGGEPLFTPDGKRMVPTTGGQVRLWDTETGQPLIEPINRAEFVRSAQFSPNNRQILIAAAHEARVLDISPAENECPGWVCRLAESIAQQHLGDRGFFEPLPTDAANIVSEIKDQLSRTTVDDGWVIWGRWFLADRSTRTISPFSKITVPEYIENQIKEKLPSPSSLPSLPPNPFGR